MAALVTSAALATLAALPPGAVCSVTGGAGTGKSRLVMAADQAGAFPRRVVFDPYARRDAALAARGEPVTPWPGEVVDLVDLLADVALAREEGRPSILDRRRLSLVVQPDVSVRRAALARDFAALAELLWHTGGIDLLAEEVALYGREATELMARLSTGGRHAAMRLVVVSQSMAYVPAAARYHLTHLVVLAGAEPVDLDYLRRRCGPEFAARARELRRGDAPLVWSSTAPAPEEGRNTRVRAKRAGGRR